MTPSPPDRESLLDGIRELARDKLDFHGEVDLGSRLVEDLELDSIQLLTLAMEVEDRFLVCLDESDEAGIRTVADLLDVVEAKLADGGVKKVGGEEAGDGEAGDG